MKIFRFTAAPARNLSFPILVIAGYGSGFKNFTKDGMEKALVILLALCIFFSCSTTDDISGNEVLGQWTWVETSGGLAGTQVTPKTTQQVVRLEISGNSIKRFVDGELESNRGYTIERKKSMIYGEENEMIIYDNGFRELFITTGNRLTLIQDCNDCHTSVYTRTGSIKP